jgi:hypothetical protein
MQQNVSITFSDNIFLVGFRELYEIKEVLEILACIHTNDNIYLDEGIIISIFLIIPEEMLVNNKSKTSEEIDFIYQLYDELKKSAKFNFIFNFTLRLFLENIIPNLNKNTFCYIFGHGNPVIKVLDQQSEIIIGDDLLTGEKINYFFSHNANGIYLFFQYASCYNSLMFTKTNIHERILSIQDIECQSIRAEFSCKAVAQNNLFSQYNSINDILNKSHRNNKAFIYKNLNIDDLITFTLYDNHTEKDSVSADDDTENYEDYENYASDENSESYGGKSRKGKRKRRKSKKKSKRKTRKTRNKSRKNNKTK